MKRLIEKAMNMPYAVLAAATATAVAVPTQARAASTLGERAQQLIDQVSSIGKLLVAGCVLGGIVMLGTGLMKLKAASDNPNQTKYSEGFWRIGVGAAMLAIPVLSGTLNQTLFGEEGVSLTQGGGASF
jgi:hypothetical protein